MQFELHKPIGVFDAGIGSYSIVDLIRRNFPLQDIIYFADRASFPYGAKTRAELADSVNRAIETLVKLGASTVVLASNAPSVMVLDEVAAEQAVPVLGVFPPVAEALKISRSGVVAVIGVQSLVESNEIREYIQREGEGRAVELVNGSPLVQLVEDGTFISDPFRTQAVVNTFMGQLSEMHPELDTCTLSSTHLPWLKPFFVKSTRGIEYIDPAESLLPLLKPRIREGYGRTVCIATQSDSLPLTGLVQMFRRLGLTIHPHLVQP